MAQPRGEAVREPRALIAPAWGYYALFFLAPVLIIVAYAFATRSGFFDIRFGFDTRNFVELWDPLYIEIYGQTFLLALLGTLGCLAVGYPLAYWLATRVRRYRTVLLMLVIVPFWTSILIRTYAWQMLLNREGPLSDALQALGVFSNPLTILYTPTAVWIGVVYDYLPLMIFPLYVAIERVDRSLIEASSDLGVGRWRTFWRITRPLTMPGILTGCLLVFVPMTGEYVVPTILGGGKGAYFGPIVASTLLDAFDYPFGAAMSLVLVAFLLVLIVLYLRGLGRRAEETLGAVL